MMYCKTVSECDGRHMYGIDLISFEDGKFNVLLSAPNVTDDWVPLCRFVNWLNIIKVPPTRFYEFLDAFRDKFADDVQVQSSSDSGLPNEGKREYSIYGIREKCFGGRSSKYPNGLDKNAIDRICRILDCRPDELYLPEGR